MTTGKSSKTFNFYVQYEVLGKFWCYHIVLKDSEVFATGEGQGRDSEIGRWRMGRMEIVLHTNSE